MARELWWLPLVWLPRYARHSATATSDACPVAFELSMGSQLAIVWHCICLLYCPVMLLSSIRCQSFQRVTSRIACSADVDHKISCTARNWCKLEANCEACHFMSIDRILARFSQTFSPRYTHTHTHTHTHTYTHTHTHTHIHTQTHTHNQQH